MELEVSVFGGFSSSANDYQLVLIFVRALPGSWEPIFEPFVAYEAFSTFTECVRPVRAGDDDLASRRDDLAVQERKKVGCVAIRGV